MELNYLILPGTDAAWNLACEQFVFESLPRDRRYLLLWQNKRAVVIGKYQNAQAEINAELLKAREIQLVRRLSGGGAVYHDLGNLNYSLVADAEPSGRLDFAVFCQPVLQTLHTLGVPAELSGRNDLTLDGKKFSGSAQYIRQARVLHHGTLLFDSDLDAIGSVLRVNADKLQSKGVASVRSRVTNLRPWLPTGLDLAAFRSLLLEGILHKWPGEPYVLSEDELAAIGRIKRERYDRWDWTYGRSPAGSLVKARRFEGCGTVEAHCSTDRGRLTQLSFTGDFFSERDPQELAEKLIGKRLAEEELRDLLAETEIERYFIGLSTEAFLSLLLY